MIKSSVIPIQCTDEQVREFKRHLQCQVANFPCKYLGLPLAIRRLTKEDLQPILDQISDMLPGWKAPLMARAGRLVLVRAVLTAVPIYTLMALEIPKWAIKAIEKIIRAFLWRGRKEARGGHCPIAWDCVTRPLQLGGLGIHNLTTLGWALQPWATFNI